MDSDSLLKALKDYFGFNSFLPGQEETITSVLQGRDVLAIMPTGGGKSLCYQLPAQLLKGTTIVISPLIALMKDQVDSLLERKIKGVTLINSSIPVYKQEQRMRSILQDEYKLVYIAPERFRSRQFISVLSASRISLLVVDEAHCISQWGHDFRPDYLYIRQALEKMGHPRILALTATATPHVQNDILNQLRLKEAAKVITGFDRPNLVFEVKYNRDNIEKYQEVQRLVTTLKGMGIIYVGTRQRAEEMASFLRALEIPSASYHAGMGREERIDIQEKFMTERIQVVAATNAFGMGIDKSNIRYIIHFKMPGTVEAYYQEAGRAGRDGQEARCILLYSPTDMTLQKNFIEKDTPSKEEIIAIYDYIREQFRGKEEEIIISEKIELATGLNDTKVRVSISILEQIGALKRMPDCSHQVEIKPLVPEAELWSGIKHQGSLTQEIFHIVGEKRRIDIPELARQLNHTYDRIEDAFLGLYCKGLIEYRSYARGMTIRLSAPREEGRYLRLDATELRRHKNWRYQQLQAIVNYGESALCRRYYIRSYFGEKNIPQNCSACDNCLASLEKVRPGIEAGEEEISPSGINYFLQILECLKGIGWGVGRQILVQILTGSKAQRMHSYQRGKHYACLKGMNQKKLLRQVESLIKNGFLRTEISEYPVLVLTPRSRKILTGNITSDDKAIIARFNQEMEKLLPHPQRKGAIAMPSSAQEIKDLILRCALQVEGRVGRSGLVEILKGSRSKMIKRHDFDRLDYYGRLTQLTGKEIMNEITNLVDEEYLTLTSGFYPLVRLTSKGEERLQKGGAIRLRKEINVEKFLTGPHPRELKGDYFDSGYALDFNSGFRDGEWQRTKLGQLVYEYKYQGCQEHAPILAERLFGFLRERARFGKIDYMVAIPATRKHRSYEPVPLLARLLSQKIAVPFKEGLIVKVREARLQKEMKNIIQKKKNTENAFRVTEPIRVKGMNILIVDDFYDSGVTVDECARVLKRAGAKKAYVLTLTRTIHH